jgi:hypothetical protein
VAAIFAAEPQREAGALLVEGGGSGHLHAETLARRVLI